MENSSKMKFLESLKTSWKGLLVVLTPIVLSPLVFPYEERPQESKCAFLIILMAVYWVTESLPLPVTSLLPVPLCPLLGIASSKVMCKVYFGDITFLLLGGIFVAIAIEECKLHKRLALKILMIIGVKPRRLMLGIMLTTAFLSMWISNTATTAMMIPITRALLAKLFSSNPTRDPDNQPHRNGRSVADQKEELLEIEADHTGHYAAKDSKNIESIETGTAVDRKLSTSAVVFSGLVDEEDTILDQSFHGQLHLPPVRHDRYHHLQQHEETLPEVEENSHHEEETKLMSNEQQENGEIKMADNDDDTEEDECDTILKNLDPERTEMLKLFSLCVCYSANIGGMATLTGTAPNMVLSRMVAEIGGNSIITFASWFAYGLPVSVLTLLATYVWLNISVFGLKSTIKCTTQVSEEESKRAMETMQQEYRKLGEIKFSEIIVLIHFLALVFLWLLRSPGSFPGWSVIFKDRYVTDGATAMAVALSLFIFPSQRPNVLFFRQKGDTSESKSMPAILNWKQASRKFPWGVQLLLGGGFALSKASQISGLSKLIANNLMFIQFIPMWSASLFVALLTSFLTEITSNTVITMLLLPILKDIAIAMEIHPLYFMLPITVAASLAFILPVATPPNALVFAYGDVGVVDMVKRGFFLNIIGIAVITLGTNTWGYAFFNLDQLPQWALPNADVNTTTTNVTMMSDFIQNFTTSTSSTLNIPL